MDNTAQMVAAAERRLWCAVIEQALADIGVIKDERSGKYRSASPFSAEYDDAVRWLIYEKQDFLLVCSMAGISPCIVRKAAKLSRAR